MKPYLDGGFLLVLLSQSRGTKTASTILQKLSPPIEINFLHQLQVENMLIRFQKSEEEHLQVGSNQGLRLWNHYLQEGVFTLTPADWEKAFRNAITWNRHTQDAPPTAWLFLHPALALSAGVTHFCSFDPRTRAMAQSHGIRLIPGRV